MTTSRSFAIIPAAGHSRRMGRPKLLLPWRNATLIDHILSIWTASSVSRTVVVIRGNDQPLADVCRTWSVDIVLATVDPPDMKASVQLGLQHIRDRHQPVAQDRWLVAPADLPGLSTALIDRLIDAGRSAPNHRNVTVPRFGERQGHPVLFTWPLAADVDALGEDEGLDRIVAREEKYWVDCPHEESLGDIDTPDDYRRMRARDA